jgi:hypothetical protein
MQWGASSSPRPPSLVGHPQGYAQTMPTRWLLVAAAVTAALILVAGVAWLLWFL